MKSALLATLLAVGYSQQQTCMYTANDGEYTLNLTQVSGWTLEYESPGKFFYYTPCRNGLRCTQGGALYAANAQESQPGSNQCLHWLAVDHHEKPQYSFVGAAWRFGYEDGQLCDVTQEPRKTTIYYHCNDVGNQSPAHLETAYESSTCNYYYSISSTLACVPPERHNAACQWRHPDGNGGYYYLDLSELKGETIHGEWQNGYEMYYSVCANNLHCWQQGDAQVMSSIDNRQTGTCEHTLAVWEEGRNQPLLYTNGAQHWSFHYYNGEICSNGQNGEEHIRWFCDKDVDTYKVLGVGEQSSCNFFMNISSKYACLDQEQRWVDATKAFV